MHLVGTMLIDTLYYFIRCSVGHHDECIVLHGWSIVGRALPFLSMIL